MKRSHSFELISLVLGVLWGQLAAAQPHGPTVAWAHFYYGDSLVGTNAAGQIVHETSDHGFVVPGIWCDSLNQTCDAWAMVTDSVGRIRWVRRYGGDGGENFLDGRSAATGGFIFAGLSTSFGSILGATYLVRTDNQGDTIWTHVLPEQFEFAQKVDCFANGDFAVAGRYVTSHAGVGVFLLRVGDAGAVQWTDTFTIPIPAAANITVYGLQVTSRQTSLLCGKKCLGSAGCVAWAAEVSASGEVLWNRFYPDSIGAPYSAQELPDQTFILAGNCSGNFMLMHLDHDGALLSEATVPHGIRVPSESGATLGSNGGFVFTGKQYDQAFLTKVDVHGQVFWDLLLNTPEYVTGGLCVERISDGGFIIHGNFGLLVRLSPDDPETAANVAPAVAQTFQLLQNFPNPFNNATMLSFFLAKSEFVSLKVFDVLGREVAEPANSTIGPGHILIPVTLPHSGSGLYFARLQTHDRYVSRAMILLR
jgi:hypothetical protein